MIYSNGWARVYPKQMASMALTPGPTNEGDYIARTKAKATDPSRLIQILVDEQFEQLAPILDIIPGRERWQ